MNTLQSLFAQKAWTNTELFQRLGTVDPAQHATALHTALRTLNHIYVVDHIFRAHLLGESHAYTATNTDETPTRDALALAVAETDTWFVGYVDQLRSEDLAERLRFHFTDGDAGEMSREEMLMHVILHGAYHRGNVGQVLKSIAVTPPRDLLTKFLHTTQPERRQA
jgi:uncharacterized damage-inducible protein DinB